MTMTIEKMLLDVGRQLVTSGLVAGTWGNISGWDEERDGFWITPSGMDYLTLQEADLVLLAKTGEKLSGIRKPSSEYLLHQAIYQSRPEVLGIVHTHSVYATAHAVARTAIPGIVEDMAQIVGGSVDVAEYAAPGTDQLAEAAVAALAGKDAVLLANHGLVGVGRTVAEALRVCQVVEKSAQIHVMSRLIGTPLVLSDNEINQMREGYLKYYGQH